MDSLDQLEEARRARVAGDYKSAELLCREILDRDPVHPDASGFLGQCLAEQGELGAAEKYVDLALGLAPNNADVRLNAAVLRERQGDLAGAIKEAVRAAELNSSRFEILATLGNLLGKAGAFDKAAAALAKACRINPRHPGAALLLAGACMEIGDWRAANKALDLVDAAAPGLPQSLKLRTHVARAARDPAAIVLHATRWMEVDPGDEEARVALAYGLAQQGYFARAAEIFRPLADATPPRAEHLAAMGRYRLGARALEDAMRWFERALAADPGCAEAHFGRARIFTYTGRLDEAEAACRRAVDADPSHVEAIAQLTEIVGGALDDEELARLETMCAGATLNEEARPTALFALGEVLRRRGRPVAAFDAWSRANDMKAQAALNSAAGGYDPRRQEETTARLKALFPKDPGTRPVAPPGADPTPIFIVGMPRSGTTLLESALAAHPAIAGGGELPALPFILQEFLDWSRRSAFPVEQIPAALLAEWRATYARQIADFGLERRAFLADKQPSNFLAIGLIRELFPAARIIHIRRNPLETGFSIYRRNFSRQWPFAHEQRSIGHYYGQYADIMAHWEANYADAFDFVQYEDLVADFEGELRRLLGGCGLPFDASCLKFYDVDRPVITFSAVQVRKPPTNAHFGAAAKYKEFLEPLRAALIEANVDLSTGAKAQLTRAGDQPLH